MLAKATVKISEAMDMMARNKERQINLLQLIYRQLNKEI